MSPSHPPRRGGPGGRRRPSGSGSAPRRPDPTIAPLHPTLDPPDIRSFREWNLGEEIQGAIETMGITTPTPIQRLAIQHVLDGRDVIAKAETGTGKTLAFGAGMMAKIDPARASVLGLVLCPTRELAEQVQKVLEVLGRARGVKVALVVGGEPLEPQVTALKGGAQVVVGTPGRILDLYKQRFLSFPWTEFTILDEADVMLEIGFIDDVKQILSYAPDERQTLLFSATFPPELLKLAREYTKNPVEIATASGVSTVDTIEQSWIECAEEDRPLALIRLIEQSPPEDVFLVFCDRRTEVDKLMRRLERLPFSIKALHGGYDQAARFRVMSAFRTGEVKVLVATDVASRGLDVKHVTTVLNYGSPQDITDYTHRIGRTGRAGRKGRAITLVGRMDMRRWRPLQRDATWDIPQVELPGPSRSGGRRDDRGPRDGSRTRDEGRPARRQDAPQPSRPAREASAAPRGDARRAAWPSDERAPRHAPAPAREAQWPTDEEAGVEAARHREVRPNRVSPRAPRGDDDRPRTRVSTSEARPPRERTGRPSDAGDAPREPRRGERSANPREHAHEQRAPLARTADRPREERGRGHGDETRASDRASAAPARSQAPRGDDARRPADRASAPQSAARHGRDERRGPPQGGDAPRRAEVRVEGDAPRSEARPTGSGGNASRSAHEPRRAGPPRSEGGRDAGSGARTSPPERRPRSEERRPPQSRRETPVLEERPPGTFERPLTGGLLGHAARRPTPPEPRPQSGRRPRRDS